MKEIIKFQILKMFQTFNVEILPDLSEVMSTSFPDDDLTDQFRYEISPQPQTQNDELTVISKWVCH